MNKLDKQYQDLLQDILDNGVTKQDRTGTGTISVFGRQIRHDMKDGFPLLTTKKMPFKTIVTELLWFLRGDTNIKYLVDNNCHIWDGDAYKNYLNKNMFLPDPKWLKETEDGEYDLLDNDEFVNRIKTDDEFAKKWGELGPIYGAQWRGRLKGYGFNEITGAPLGYGIDPKLDQIANLINDLKTNPDSRRLMVNAWNVGELDQMVLPPCHYGFQVYTRELSLDERMELMIKKHGMILEGGDETLPTRAISLMWNQRSVDTFLGLAFNIASYGLLLEILAKEVNMVPDQLIGNFGDVHLYSNHLEQAKEQIGRELTHDEIVEYFYTHIRPETQWKKENDEYFYYSENNSMWVQHSTSDIIFGMTPDCPKRTREPFELPTLKFSNWYKNANEEQHSSIVFNDWVESLKPDDFILENYQSHPTIKAPLSN